MQVSEGSNWGNFHLFRHVGTVHSKAKTPPFLFSFGQTGMYGPVQGAVESRFSGVKREGSGHHSNSTRTSNK